MTFSLCQVALAVLEVQTVCFVELSNVSSTTKSSFQIDVVFGLANNWTLKGKFDKISLKIDYR